MLLAAAAVAYSGLARNDFISVDDETYLTNNPPVLAGLSWRGVRWAFTTFHASNWHPLTWLSLMAGCDLFGTWPAAHHCVNELLHLANVALLFFLLLRMTDRLAPSAFVAGVFALHPVHVESVAWLAERKDVLSACFFLLTLHAYVSYVRKPSWRRMPLIIALYALGLLSKPMLVTTPFVLLLLDYWPLRRITGSVGCASAHRLFPSTKKTSNRCAEAHITMAKLVLEKIPLFVLAIACCIVTLLAQRHAMVDMRAVPIGLRIENAIFAIPRYMLNAIWPTRLYFGYPLRPEIPTQEVLVSALLLIAITIAVVSLRRRFPPLVVGWFWFVGMLVPVLGIIQVGGVAMADRYMYLPMIGLSTAIAFSVDSIVIKQNVRRAIGALASIALIGLGVLTWIQVGYWMNSVTLFAHSLQLNSDNFIVEHNYARALLMAGKGNEAIDRYRQLVTRYPQHVTGWKSLAMALVAKGDLDEASRAIGPALDLDMTDPEIPFLAAFIAMKQNRTDDAIALYRRTLALQENIVAHYELSQLLRERDPKAAEEEARRTISLADPNDPHIQTAKRLLDVGAINESDESLYLALALTGTLGPEEQSTAEAKRAEIEARCAARLHP